MDLTILVVVGECPRDRYGDRETVGMERETVDTNEEDGTEVHIEATTDGPPTDGEAEDWPDDKETDEAKDGVGEPLNHPTDVATGM